MKALSLPSPIRTLRAYRVVSALAILGALALLVTLPVLDSPFNDVAYYGRLGQRRAQDFTLADAHGRRVGLSDFRGRFVYLMFGYLNCDQVCHPQALTFSMLSRRVRSDNVQFLYVGMDPERDTPERVRQYFDARAANFRGLIAQDMAESQRIAADYRAYFSREPGNEQTDYRINHPGFIYLIDPRGDIRLIYSGANLDPGRMLDDLTQLFQEFT